MFEPEHHSDGEGLAAKGGDELSLPEENEVFVEQARGSCHEGLFGEVRGRFHGAMVFLWCIPICK